YHRTLHSFPTRRSSDLDLFVQLANLPEATVAALKAENLALEDGPWLIPQWLYQSVYEWKQRFEPGMTEVEVSYAPRFGASNEYRSEEHTSELQSRENLV